MKKNNAFYYMVLAAHAFANVPVTPEECENYSKFLQGELSEAE